MSPDAISPRRQRMIEDMIIRRFGEHTQRDYVRQVREFTAFLGLPPDRAEPEDLRLYQLHLASLGASYARMNRACAHCASSSASRWAGLASVTAWRGYRRRSGWRSCWGPRRSRCSWPMRGA